MLCLLQRRRLRKGARSVGPELGARLQLWLFGDVVTMFFIMGVFFGTCSGPCSAWGDMAEIPLSARTSARRLPQKQKTPPRPSASPHFKPAFFDLKKGGGGTLKLTFEIFQKAAPKLPHRTGASFF